MIDVCFVKTGRAFLPEIYAYREYLHKKGITTCIADDLKQAKQIHCKVYYRFGGFLTQRVANDSLEVHEYHTISTGRFVSLKNIVKSFFSAKPDYLSFLNSYVESTYFFSSGIPTFYRDMGAESSLLDIRKLSDKKDYDICYFGSISNREGVSDAILHLASKGYQLVVGGNASEKDQELFAKHDVHYLGVCSREVVYDYLSRSRFGLNIVPDEYPLNRQTATKVIEYLVAGIPVISNNYQWIREHSMSTGYDFLDLDSAIELNNVELGRFILNEAQAKRFTWDSILDECGFYKIIKELIERYESTSSCHRSNHD
ncbi:glycosyl transferase [Vibrio rotiferianus]|uniref:Glycosyl transferase n=1 Tax=Vibrio rotiferianus TaxID=190895 RepID=A0ABX3D5R4_9VIBR|nr:glycosyltransferase [Vibrio rotiferianus]OHY90045.1 glycosyl transferase [Vibrio rotiferianus]